nr:MAG TPA: hypothetical protein [Bacteriophage sp.]
MNKPYISKCLILLLPGSFLCSLKRYISIPKFSL